MILFHELRYAARTALRTPFFTLVVVAILALGIGANTAVFSFVHALLLRPLPYPEPASLVRLESVRGGEIGRLSLRELRHLEQDVDAFAGIAAHNFDSAYNLSGEGRPEEVPAILCTRNLFEVLGVRLLYGEPWPQDYDRRESYGVVLGHELWQRRFGGDPGVVSQVITLDSAPYYQVFGVLPPGFDYPVRSDIFRSLAFIDLDDESRDARYYVGLARLAPGVELAAARAKVEALARKLAAEHPDTNAGIEIRLTSLAETYTGRARPYLLMLWGAVGFVLAMVAANVVNLLMARAASREREVAVRVALGAGRTELVRQLLIESLLLALLGGVAGLALGELCIRMLRALIDVELPFWMHVEIDFAVLLFSFGITVAIGIVTGLAPALRLASRDPGGHLKDGTRGSTSGGRRRIRQALVACQVAAALVLLAGAILMTRSFENLERAELGFEPDQLLTFRVALGWKAYDEVSKTEAFYRDLLERLGASPGVLGVATNSNLPLAGGDRRRTFTLEGQSVAEQQRNPYVNKQRVSHGYFELMGTPIVEGRAFEARDTSSSPLAAVISKRLATTLFPSGAIGQRLKIGEPESDQPWMTVVGVAGDVRHGEVDGEPGFDLYVSSLQRPSHNAFVLIRTSVPPRSLERAATEAVWATDPDQSSYDVATMRDRIDAKIWQKRLARTLISLFALLATVLAAVGLHGVMSFTVRQRQREMGIRLALGEKRGAVLRSVLGESLKLAGLGAAVGLVGAWMLGRWIESLLYGIDPSEPVTLLGIALFLVLVAAIASWIPARRASRVDPIICLREE